MTMNSVTETISVGAGTYYFSNDNSAADFGLALETALESHSEATNFTVRLYNVDFVDTAKADGRLNIVNVTGDHEFTLDWDHANTTLDPRICGFAAADTGPTSTSYVLISDYVHKYGWYPQNFAAEHHAQQKQRGHVEFSTGGYPDAVIWPEHGILPLVWDHVPSPLVRIDAANDSDHNPTDYGLTLGDVNCAWERFCLDAASDTDERVRYYKDITVTTDPGTNYILALPEQYRDPLAPPSRITFREGEIWAIATRLVSEP
jgi:hypothetical protein